MNITLQASSIVTYGLVTLVAIMVAWAVRTLIVFLRKHPIILEGIKELLASPSGAFSLLVLLAISVVSLKQPTIGGVALAAFAGVVPACLGYFEHKEQMSQYVPPPPLPVPPPPDPNPAKPVPDPSNVPV
jgi:uncharacterized membrane protein